VRDAKMGAIKSNYIVNYLSRSMAINFLLTTYIWYVAAVVD